MLLDEVRKAHQIIKTNEFKLLFEEYENTSEKDKFKDEIIKLLDLPRHSSITNILDYIRELVEETKKLTDTINSHGI